ncbi:hypothetical protein Tco_0763049 [Tanacetum coccineum]
MKYKDLSKASNYDNYGLVPQLQKTSDHNRSELSIHDHNNEPLSSMLVPNVSPPADTNAPSIQEFRISIQSFLSEEILHYKCDSIGTPLATKPKLDADLSRKTGDQTNYRSMIGSLVYLTSSRPDLEQAYPKDSGFKLTAFSDVVHAGCIDTRKSMSGGIHFLGDKSVSWMSKKQDYTTMLLAKVEYVALSTSCAQVMWMRTQLKDYGFNYSKIPLYCDSQSAIAISCNPVQHSHTKHIHTRYHFIKEQVERGIIELYFVRTEYQLAGMFT